MSRKNTRILGLSKLTIALACLLGSGLGLLLGSLDAPLWAFYAGALAMLLPLLIYELPRAAAEEDRERGRY
jgi:hypothetical protein